MKFVVIAVLLSFLFIFTSSVQAEITINVTNSIQDYSPGDRLSGVVEIIFDTLIPKSSSLIAYVDGQVVTSTTLGPYVNDPAFYSYKKHVFDYNLTAQGENEWKEYPAQPFEVFMIVNSTCGQMGPENQCYNTSNGQDFCSCPCQGPPYPCQWGASLPLSSLEVKGSDGLKFHYDLLTSVALPQDNNPEDTNYTVIDSHTNVQTTMRAACGGQVYNSFLSRPKGWITRPLPSSSFNGISGTPHKDIYIEQFDLSSLDAPNNALFDDGPVGGVYKTPIGTQNSILLKNGTDVEYFSNFTTGYVKIFNFESTSTYHIKYLPPNGQMLCSYTSFNVPQSFTWDKGIIISGLTTDYQAPYSKTFTAAELNSILAPPNCPSNVNPVDCTKNVNKYIVYETSDPDNAVSVSYDETAQRVTGTSQDTTLVQKYFTSLGLNNFANLKAPQAVGGHTLELRVTDQGNELGRGSFSFTTCADNDGDGFCGAQDCDDTDKNIHPGAAEVCDGKDQNCDGNVDEAFWKAGTKLGTSCGIGACAGIFVCTPDGSDVVCNNKFIAGQQVEICADNIDNDCDGQADEEFETKDGKQVKACFCKNSETKPCGSDQGACRVGYRICQNNAWSECIDQVVPKSESCNNIDDNCDGKVDNIDTDASLCGCANGGSPSPEICNEIDDNCDGNIDEGIICCQPGEERACGKNAGICQPGRQTCTSEGSWGSCIGGTQPRQEACHNNIDDNCNGQVDEGCHLDPTCRNGVLDEGEEEIDCGGTLCSACVTIDFATLVSLSLVILIILVIVGFVAVKKIKTLGP